MILPAVVSAPGAMGDDPEALGSMQLTVFLQIRQTRNGTVELTRRVQLPVAEGPAALRKAVKERVADLPWFASGISLDLIDSKHDTEYELDDGTVLADGAKVIVQPTNPQLPQIGVPAAVAQRPGTGGSKSRATTPPDGEDLSAALSQFLTGNMKKVMDLFKEWDEGRPGGLEPRTSAAHRPGGLGPWTRRLERPLCSSSHASAPRPAAQTATAQSRSASSSGR